MESVAETNHESTSTPLAITASLVPLSLHGPGPEANRAAIIEKLCNYFPVPLHLSDSAGAYGEDGKEVLPESSTWGDCLRGTVLVLKRRQGAPQPQSLQYKACSFLKAFLAKEGPVSEYLCVRQCDSMQFKTPLMLLPLSSFQDLESFLVEKSKGEDVKFETHSDLWEFAYQQIVDAESKKERRFKDLLGSVQRLTLYDFSKPVFNAPKKDLADCLEWACVHTHVHLGHLQLMAAHRTIRQREENAAPAKKKRIVETCDAQQKLRERYRITLDNFMTKFSADPKDMWLGWLVKPGTHLLGVPLQPQLVIEALTGVIQHYQEICSHNSQLLVKLAAHRLREIQASPYRKTWDDVAPLIEDHHRTCTLTDMFEKRAELDLRDVVGKSGFGKVCLEAFHLPKSLKAVIISYSLDRLDEVVAAAAEGMSLAEPDPDFTAEAAWRSVLGAVRRATGSEYFAEFESAPPPVDPAQAEKRLALAQMLAGDFMTCFLDLDEEPEHGMEQLKIYLAVCQDPSVRAVLTGRPRNYLDLNVEHFVRVVLKVAAWKPVGRGIHTWNTEKRCICKGREHLKNLLEHYFAGQNVSDDLFVEVNFYLS